MHCVVQHYAPSKNITTTFAGEAYEDETKVRKNKKGKITEGEILRGASKRKSLSVLANRALF